MKNLTVIIETLKDTKVEMTYEFNGNQLYVGETTTVDGDGPVIVRMVTKGTNVRMRTEMGGVFTDRVGLIEY